MRRILFVVVLMGLVLSACSGGGSDEGSGGSDPTPAATAPDDTDSAPVTTQPAEDDSEDPGEVEGGPSTATVTIGDETYEFSSEGAIVAQCLTDMFGIFAVQLPMADGGDGSIQIFALHEGTDPSVVEQDNEVHITIGDVDWLADPMDTRLVDNPDVSEGQSQVDSVEVDGNTVRGTLSLVGSQTVFSADFIEFATGTFEATCGEERTS